MSIPNNKNEPFTTEETRLLIESIKKSQRWIAERTGISERRLRYLLAGGRHVEGKWVETQLSYPERYVLEILSEAAALMDIP